jgi:hypothetical protein
MTESDAVRYRPHRRFLVLIYRRTSAHYAVIRLGRVGQRRTSAVARLAAPKRMVAWKVNLFEMDVGSLPLVPCQREMKPALV